MNRPRTTRSAWLLAIVALTSAACNDSPTSVAPTVTQPDAAVLAAAPKPRRTPYISDIQLSSIYVSISGGYTPFTVTVTNPGQKDYQLMYLKGELQSQNNQPPLPATAFLAYCPNPNGIIPSGTCTMSNGITGGATLAPGPGTYTLKLLQKQADDTMKEIDRRTVDVILRQF
jgi:hypothetical protein